MDRYIRKAISIKKADEKMNLILVLGGVVLAFLITFASGDLGTDAHSVVHVMCTAVAGSYVIGSMFLKVLVMTEEVIRGLSFGITRRELFAINRIVEILELIVISIPVLIVFNDRLGLVFKLIAISFGLFMWVEGIAGNNVIRYGKTAYWIYYAAFFCVMMGVPRLADIFPKFGMFLSSLALSIANSEANQLNVWCAIMFFVIVGFGVNWLTFRKIPVNHAV